MKWHYSIMVAIGIAGQAYGASCFECCKSKEAPKASGITAGPVVDGLLAVPAGAGYGAAGAAPAKTKPRGGAAGQPAAAAALSRLSSGAPSSRIFDFAPKAAENTADAKKGDPKTVTPPKDSKSQGHSHESTPATTPLNTTKVVVVAPVGSKESDLRMRRLHIGHTTPPQQTSGPSTPATRPTHSGAPTPNAATLKLAVATGFKVDEKGHVRTSSTATGAGVPKVDEL